MAWIDALRESGGSDAVTAAVVEERKEIERYGGDPARQAQYIQTLLNDHVSTYLKLRENGGQTFPDFVGALALTLNELPRCVELSAVYKAKCQTERDARAARVEAEEKAYCEAQNRAAEQAPHELVERCHQAAWRKKDHQANFEQKKNLVKIISGACDYGYYSGREQWHIQTDGKAVLKGLAHFETGTFDRYPDGIGDLLSEDEYLWYDLLEFEDCEKLEKIRLFKNGRMDIRFTNEGCAREFVATYLGSVW